MHSVTVHGCSLGESIGIIDGDAMALPKEECWTQVSIINGKGTSGNSLKKCMSSFMYGQIIMIDPISYFWGVKWWNRKRLLPDRDRLSITTRGGYKT
jgi:hypothetical protein